MDIQYDEDKDSVHSLKTGRLTSGSVIHLMKLLGHRTNNTPTAPEKRTSFETIDLP